MAPGVAKRKRKAWTIEQKLFVADLGQQKPKPALDAISRAFESRFQTRASIGTLNNWLQPRVVEKVRAQAVWYGKERRRVKPGKYPKLEAALFLWFKGGVPG